MNRLSQFASVLLVVVVASGLALLASLPGWFIATVAIGAFAFAMARKHAPNWTPWRDSKGESVFGGGRPSSPSGGLDLQPIKTDRKGRRL